MQRSYAVAVLVAASMLIVPSARAASPVERMVETEREFAASALAGGVRSAFLRYMAEDGIIFRPGPVDARQWYRDLPESEVTLRWQPTFAGTSHAGDLGFSSGPWQLSRPEPDSTPAHGHFISVWRLQADDSWRVVLDVGTSHADSGPAGELVLLERPTAPAVDSPPGTIDELSRAEIDLCRTVRSAGAAAAYRGVADESFRLYRAGARPDVGRTAALLGLTSVDPPESCDPPTVELSSSGDLGYAYRVDESGGGFVRIWRRGEFGWRVVIAVLLPGKPTKEPS